LKELDSLRDFYPNLQAQWVRGHNGDPMNELADSLAVDASNEAEVDRTVSYIA
jgi:ribonuclease HI